MTKHTLTFFATLIFMVSACKKEEEAPAKTPEVKIDTPVIVKEKIIELSTDFGNIYIWLHKQTPLHRTNFINLADSGFFNQTTFHRIIPGFMIQGGDPNSKDSDPNNDGQGGPGYTIPAEIIDSLKNSRGSVAAARLSDAVNPLRASSGSQFYINVVNNTHLDGKYTVFGQVIKGMQVADSIVVQSRDMNTNRPFSDIKMTVKVLEKTAAELLSDYQFTVPQ